MVAAGEILAPGTRLGGYRIDDVIGIGGMAVVYLAQQESLDRAVALKVLASQLAREPSFRERFRHEALNVAALEHPSIVPIYDAGEADGYAYIAMRYIEGGTLVNRMSGGLAFDDAIRLLTPVAAALDAAHTHGLVHRDIKPQNILLTGDDYPYLADFGVAKGSESPGLTATGSFIGTISYASPEQFRGDPLTPASDLYGLTALLFQCLSGQVPYPRETDPAVMHAHLVDEPPQLVAGDAAINRAIARGMAKDPSQRHASALALIADVQAAHAELPAGTNLRSDGVPPGAFRASTGGTTSALDRSSVVPDAPTPGVPAAGRRPNARTTRSAGRNVDRMPSGSVGWIAGRAGAGRFAGRIGLPVVAGAAAIGLVVAGAVARPTSPEAPALAVVQAGDLRLPYDGAWRPARADRGTPGIADPQRLTSTAPGAEVDAQVGRLDPAPAVRGGAPTMLASRATAAPVRIGPFDAMRYDGIDRATKRPARAYVLATDRGHLAVVCRAPVGATEALTRCDALAARAEVPEATVLELGPDGGWAARASEILRPVVAARSGAALGGREVAARATRAAKLADVQSTAARQLRAVDPPTPVRSTVAAVIAGLQRESTAMRRLARAARKRNRPAYGAARSAIHRDERRLSAALQALRRHGYDVGDER